MVVGLISLSSVEVTEGVIYEILGSVPNMLLNIDPSKGG